LPEVVDDGRTGLLVASDSPEALSTAVVSLLRDKIRRQEMGECGLNLVRERFDLKVSVGTMEQLYRHILTTQAGT